MSFNESMKKENVNRLSLFGQRLQSLSETFYSTILEDPKEKEIVKSAEELERLKEKCQSNDFTFDQCSTLNEFSSKDNFSFTFHSRNESTKFSKDKSHRTTNSKQIKEMERKSRIHSSTPNRIEEEHVEKNQHQDQTVLVNENPRQPIVVGYYPVITYQPLCFPSPPTIFLSKEQIPYQFNDLNQFKPIQTSRK